MIIYKITNLKNNKIYVGLTTLKSAQHRFNKHVSEAKNSKENRYFLNAITKYGKENFKVEQIDFAYTIEELKQKEINYIKLLNSTNKNIGYNLSLGGDGTPGVLKSEETKNNIREKALGRKVSDETKLKMSITRKTNNTDFSKGKENLKLYNQKIIVKISKYNLKKEYICTYNSISELLNCENIDRAGLWRYLKTNKFNINKGYKGFLYKKE